MEHARRIILTWWSSTFQDKDKQIMAFVIDKSCICSPAAQMQTLEKVHIIH
jgi:hypothetical protein